MTDFSDSANQALSVAVDLASRHGAVLHLFHGLPLHTNRAIDRALDACADTATGRAARLVEQDPTGRLPEVRVSQLHAVSAFDAIMQRVTPLQPDLVVMGTHGRGGLGRVLMGSTAERVLRYAPGNVVTVKSAVHRGASGDPQRVLVPVDFSDGSAQALDAARWLARATDGQLHLLHVARASSAGPHAGCQSA